MTTTATIRSRVLREFTEAVTEGVALVAKLADPRPSRVAELPLAELEEGDIRALAKWSLFQADDGTYYYTAGSHVVQRKAVSTSTGEDTVLQMRLIKMGEASAAWKNISDLGDIKAAAYGVLKGLGSHGAFADTLVLGASADGAGVPTTIEVEPPAETLSMRQGAAAGESVTVAHATAALSLNFELVRRHGARGRLSSCAAGLGTARAVLLHPGGGVSCARGMRHTAARFEVGGRQPAIPRGCTRREGRRARVRQRHEGQTRRARTAVAQLYQRALLRTQLDSSAGAGAAVGRDLEEALQGWVQPAVYYCIPAAA